MTNNYSTGGPQKLHKNWRITLNILFVGVVVFIIAYKIINKLELQTTSALFIGLPMLVGLLIVNLTRTSTAYGMTVKATIIILCLVAPLLGEGSICILMAAPIFLAMNLFIVFLYQTIRKKFFLPVVVFIPFFTGIVEKHFFQQHQVVVSLSTETRMAGSIVRVAGENQRNPAHHKRCTIFSSFGISSSRGNGKKRQQGCGLF